MRRPLFGPFWLLLMALMLCMPAVHAAAPATPAAAATPATAASMPAGPHAMPSHTTEEAVKAARERNRPKPVAHYVDINSAGRKELMTLQGIGAAEADKIIANRPYLTKTELVTKGVLETGPFLSIKNYVVAMQKFDKKKVKATPPAKAATPAAKPAAPAASAAKAP
jgi:competence protein ComEA